MRFRARSRASASAAAGFSLKEGELDDLDKRFPRKKRGSEEKTARSKFASAMARAEFGRFYWSGEQEKRLAETMRGPKPAPAGKFKPKK